MDSFESRLAHATRSSNPELLAAAGLVFDSTGKTLYFHESGRQKLSLNSPPIDEETTIFTGSAGNFISHIATLQLVEQGVIGLDESIFGFLPELEELPIISADAEDSSKFTLRPRTKPITVRHLLTHSSGVPGDGNPLIEAWRRATPPKQWPPGTDRGIQICALPLLFEPGEGWEYGHSVHLLQPLISRASGEDFIDYVSKHIFSPLGMNASDYATQEALILDKVLQAVQREGENGLVAAPTDIYRSQISSISDFKRILYELISPSPRLISPESVALLLKPAFSSESAALKALRDNTDDYAAPAGLSPGQLSPPVNFNATGSLVVMDELPESRFSAGIVTWNGSPNVVWAVHPEKGVGMLFATQLAPVDDPVTISIMMEFFKGVASTYL